jgi:hypothetical protein
MAAEQNEPINTDPPPLTPKLQDHVTRFVDRHVGPLTEKEFRGIIWRTYYEGFADGYEIGNECSP